MALNLYCCLLLCTYHLISGKKEVITIADDDTNASDHPSAISAPSAQLPEPAAMKCSSKCLMTSKSASTSGTQWATSTEYK